MLGFVAKNMQLVVMLSFLVNASGPYKIGIVISTSISYMSSR